MSNPKKSKYHADEHQPLPPDVAFQLQVKEGLCTKNLNMSTLGCGFKKLYRRILTHEGSFGAKPLCARIRSSQEKSVAASGRGQRIRYRNWQPGARTYC